MTNHYWNMETRGLNKQRAEIAYRLFDWAVGLLGGEITGGGYGDVVPVETVPAKDAIEAEAVREAPYPTGPTGRKEARIKWARIILSLTLAEGRTWVEANFPNG